MNKEKKFVPDWENSHNWTEFEWEKALKYSDHLASRYFRMLERFGDLPDAEELIATRLGDQSLFQFDDLYGGDEWDEWDDGADEFDDYTTAETMDSSEVGAKPEPGDSLYYEAKPVYQKARQIALGWCNILSSVLRPEDRFWGLKILFYLGRHLSYLSISVGDGTFEHINCSISYAKRALQQLNDIMGEVDAKTDQRQRYATIFRIVKEHLLENHDIIIDHLLDCQRRREDGGLD